jgi:hypothetical protein
MKTFGKVAALEIQHRLGVIFEIIHVTTENIQVVI